MNLALLSYSLSAQEDPAPPHPLPPHSQDYGPEAIVPFNYKYLVIGTATPIQCSW